MAVQTPHGHAADPARADRNRSVRWVVAMLAVVTAFCAAACAGPPSTGGIRTATLSQSHNNVFIVAREPTASMSPSILVEGFLHALTGDQKDPGFSVAQDYLTEDAQKAWTKSGPTWDPPTKIVNSGYVVSDESEPPVDHISYPGTAPTTEASAVGAEKRVTVSGVEVADLDAYGFLSYQSPQSFQQQFTVKYVSAAVGWRIETPPTFRMIGLDAFKRVYTTYQGALPVYLPTPGDQAQHMDQVYLTQATGKADYTYDALAHAVLHGRYKGQSSQFQLAKPVTVNSSGVAVVTLQTPPANSQPQVGDLVRALGLTFRDASETQQLVSASPLNQLQVTYAGCTTGCGPQQLPLDTSQVPSVYWMCSQVPSGSQAVLVKRDLASASAPGCPTTGKPQPVVDLSGIQLAKDSPVALKQTAQSADVKSPTAPRVAAVADTAGNVWVVDDKNFADRRIWYNGATKVTDLEWDPVDGSLWIVDGGNLYRAQDPGDKGLSVDSQKAVLAGGGQLTRFKPSPDGNRAVVVTGSSGTASPPPAAMVTIDRTGGVASLSPDTSYALLDGTLETDKLNTATDAAWADGRTVVLLGVPTYSNTQKLFKVYLDGTQDSAINDPEDAQPAAKHISAAVGVVGGHTSLWVFSDGSGPIESGGTGPYVYFKKGGSTESNQEPGSTPVVITAAQS